MYYISGSLHPSLADDTELQSLHVLQLNDDGIYALVSTAAEATVTGKEIAATADAGSNTTSCSTSRITPSPWTIPDGVM